MTKRSCTRIGVALGMMAATGAVRAELPAAPTALSWMAGHWVREGDGRRSEELWFAPTENLMVGLSATSADGRTRSFEFLRIQSGAEGLEYVAMPNGRSETVFTLVAHEARRAVFENPTHDFPTRIIYWMDGEDRLHARIEGEENGETKGFEWVWERQ